MSPSDLFQSPSEGLGETQLVVTLPSVHKALSPDPAHQQHASTRLEFQTPILLISLTWVGLAM